MHSGPLRRQPGGPLPAYRVALYYDTDHRGIHKEDDDFGAITRTFGQKDRGGGRVEIGTTASEVQAAGRLEAGSLALLLPGEDESEWPVLSAGAANRVDVEGGLRVTGLVHFEGNLGIGRAPSEAHLHVVEPSGSRGQTLRLDTEDDTANPNLNFAVGGSNKANIRVRPVNGEDQLQFQVWRSGGPWAAMSISTSGKSGKVGIGTTAPMRCSPSRRRSRCCASEYNR